MEKSSEDLLTELDTEGCEQAIASALQSILDAAPQPSRQLLEASFLMARDGDLELADTWGERAGLLKARELARAAAERGDEKAALSESAAKRLYWSSRLVPALLLGHALRARDTGRHGAAMALFNAASELIAAAISPVAFDHWRSIDARFKAQKRHTENRDLKEAAIAYYAKHRGEFKSKDEAAQFIAERIVPLKPRTVRDYLTGA